MNNLGPKYPLTNEQKAELEKRFTHHPPKDDQPARYRRIRGMAYHMAEVIYENTPPSREQSIALTKLDECVMAANAAIARNE